MAKLRRHRTGETDAHVERRSTNPAWIGYMVANREIDRWSARAVGAPPGRLVLRHLLPNAMSPVIVAASLGVGVAILAESSLSFLGLGFPPDMPTWGRLLFAVCSVAVLVIGASLRLSVRRPVEASVSEQPVG